MKKVVLNVNLFYPIGTYYETSDLDFNPNTYWGGTWELEEDGTVLVSRSTKTGSKFNADLGTIVGSETHQLTINEIPNHTHYGLYDATNNTERKQSYGTGNTHTALINGMGVTEWNGTFRVGFTGEDQAHNNVQPSKIVNRWHRIA